MIQNYIGGQWLASSGKETFDIIDPATGKLLNKTPLGTAMDVAAAVKAAADAAKAEADAKAAAEAEKAAEAAKAAAAEAAAVVEAPVVEASVEATETPVADA